MLGTVDGTSERRSIGFAPRQRNTPKLQATNQFLSLLSPDVARKVGRDNAAQLYKVTMK